MNKVWHIADLADSVTKYTGGMSVSLGGGIVYPDGKAYRAEFA